MTPEEQLFQQEVQRRRRKAESLGVSVSDMREGELDEQRSREESMAQFMQTFSGLVKQAIRPVTRIPGNYADATAETFGNLGSDGFLNKLIGGLQLATGYPVFEGLGRSLVGEPVEQIATDIGAGPTTSKLAGDTANIGAQVFGPAAVGKYIQSLVSFVKGTPVGGKPASPPQLAGGRELPVVQDGQSDMVQRLGTSVTDDIARRAEGVPLTAGDGERLYRRIAYHLRGEDEAGNLVQQIEPERLPEILQKYGLSQEEFVNTYTQTVRESAQTLQQLSRLKKVLSRDVGPALDDLADRISDSVTLPGKALEFFGKVEGTRRGLLVSQLATAVRNAASQAGRIGVSAWDEAMQALYGAESVSEAANRMGDIGVSLFSRLSPQGRKVLERVLSDPEGTLANAKLISQSVHEAHGFSKVANVLNYVNRTQEMFFRRWAFEAKMRQLLRKNGETMESVNPGSIPESYFDEAVEYALEMSFAQDAKSKAVREMIGAFSKIPGLTLVQPFPRFAYANALPFVVQHSPLGFLKALGPKALKGVASGNSKEFAEAASRATIGTTMWSLALSLRNNKEAAGEKWYEVRTGENTTVDLRSYAPLSTFMFFAEAITNPEAITSRDWSEMAIGMNRTAGTARAFFDALTADDGEELKQKFYRIAGEYIGSMTVPLRQFKDFYAEVDDAEAVYRDTKQVPGLGEAESRLLGPMIGNIPEASQALPPKMVPFQEGELRTPNPSMRQFTGMIPQVKTLARQEFDRLGVRYRDVAPATGVPAADNIVSKYMAQDITATFPLIYESDGYKAMDDDVKRLFLSGYFKGIRRNATNRLKAERPEIYARTRLDRELDRNMERFIESRTGINPRDTFDNYVPEGY